MRTLASRETLGCLFGLRIESLINLHIQRDDCIAKRIALLGSLKKLEIDAPLDDVALCGILLEPKDNPSQPVWSVQLKINF